MTLLDYIMQDELEEWVKRIGRISSVSLAVKDPEGNIFFRTENFEENSQVDDRLHIQKLEIEDKEVGSIVGYMDNSERNGVADAVTLLYDLINNRLTSEIDMESMSSELATSYEEINLLFENNDLLANVLDIDKVCEITIGQVKKVSGATKRSIMFLDDSKENLLIKRIEGISEEKIADIGIEVKGSIWEEMISSGNLLLIEDIREFPEFRESAGERHDIDSFATKSFLSIPLKVKEDMIGVLNVGDKDNGDQFNSIDTKYLMALASNAAAAIENTRLHERLQRLDKLKKYFSPSLCDRLTSEQANEIMQSHQREITVVFLDMRNFTSFVQMAEPDAIMSVLRAFHEAMGNIIFYYEATLERFTGDGMMIFLGDPISDPNHASRSLKMAADMQENFLLLKEKWDIQGYGLHLGIGICSGPATLGNIGFEGRFDYAAIGNVTNTAARLCGAADGGEILISGTTLKLLGSQAQFEKKAGLQLKGITRPVEVYKFIGMRVPAC